MQLSFWADFAKETLAAVAGVGVGAWLGARFAFRLERRKAAEDRESAVNAAALELAGRRATASNPGRMTEDPPMLPPLGDLALAEIKNYSIDVYWGVADMQRFAKLMTEVKSLVAPGFFLGDNLFTWGRNNSALEDPEFVRSWQANAQNSSDFAIVWRRYILACAACHCLRIAGDFVECGVYLGSGLKTILDYLGGTSFAKTVWGYDTFDHNPVEGHEFVGQEPGLFARVQQRFAAYSQVKLVQGLLPGSLVGNSPTSIAWLHLDLNHAGAEVAVLESLFNRVTSGGLVILDDYEWAGFYRPQKKLEDPFFARQGYRVFPLPTGQGLVIKR